MNAQKLQEKLAWQTAYQLRACPDDITLFSKNAEASAHLASCMFCQERLEDVKGDKAALQEFANQMGARLPKPQSRKPETGQVWSISREKSGWGPRNRFYNAPRVLLLTAIEGSKGFIAVQLFSEKVLMGKGDVWISYAFGFAETWNTYSVHAEQLEFCWGEVAPAKLEEICRSADQEWEASPDGSILQAFREIEVSVASFFSMQAVAQLAEEYEAAPDFATQMKEWLQKFPAFVRNLTVGDMAIIGQFYAMAYVTRGGDEVDPETAEKIAQLKSDEAVKLLPIDCGCLDEKTYILKFQNLTWLSKEPLPIQITLRGVFVDDVQWENWDSDDPSLVLNNAVIRKEELQVERTFMTVSWNENSLKIDLLP